MTLAARVADVVSAWNLDETSSTRADSVASNTLGLVSAAVGSGTGKFGNAADIEASDSFTGLFKSDTAGLSTGDVKFCVSIWFKMESEPGTMGLVTKGSDVASHEYSLFTSGGSLYFRVESNAASVNAGSGLSDGNWHLGVGYHDSVGNVIGVSIDGGAAVTTSYSGGVTDGTGHFYVGTEGSAVRQWDGLLDDLVWMKGAFLSDAEISELWNSGTGVAFASWAAATGQPAVKRQGGVAFMSPGGYQLGSGQMRWRVDPRSQLVLPDKRILV